MLKGASALEKRWFWFGVFLYELESTKARIKFGLLSFKTLCVPKSVIRIDYPKESPSVGTLLEYVI